MAVVYELKCQSLICMASEAYPQAPKALFKAPENVKKRVVHTACRVNVGS